jgi:hypothetical protein
MSVIIIMRRCCFLHSYFADFFFFSLCFRGTLMTSTISPASCFFHDLKWGFDKLRHWIAFSSFFFHCPSVSLHSRWDQNFTFFTSKVLLLSAESSFPFIQKFFYLWSKVLFLLLESSFHLLRVCKFLSFLRKFYSFRSKVVHTPFLRKFTTSAFSSCWGPPDLRPRASCPSPPRPWRTWCWSSGRSAAEPGIDSTNQLQP